MTKFCFVDTETTGTSPERHHVWEIAVVLRDDAQNDRSDDVEYCWQVRPDLSTADPMALKVGRYYERCDLDDQYRSRVVVHPKGTSAWFGTEPVAAQIAKLLDGTVLAAANVGFDAAFLDKFLRANGQAPSWDYHLLEVESYAAGALGFTPPWKLDKLASALGVALPDGRHTALADARLVRDVFDAARNR